MKFNNFELQASAHITRATCKECRSDLVEVSNGLLSSVWYCPKCENVYLLRLIKAPKKDVGESFLVQCRKEILLNKLIADKRREFHRDNN